MYQIYFLLNLDYLIKMSKFRPKYFFLNHAPKVQILSFGQRVFRKKKEKIDGNFSSVKESRKSNKNKFAINLFGLVWYDC